ncbi:MAG: hypothetical protein ABW152_03015 [Candidatus Thiodiazotropha endolucinida]
MNTTAHSTHEEQMHVERFSGWPHPADAPYAEPTPLSDPAYAAWRI